METTAEGKLRGGFSSIGNAGISVCGGPNDHCDRNDVCSDNDYCYDNSDSQLVRAIEPVQTVLLIVHRQHQHPTPRRPLSQMG